MLKWVYQILCLLIICEVIFYSVTSPSKVNKKYLYLFLSSAFACASYGLCCFSTTLETLIVTNLLYNIGSICADISMLFVVAEICHFKLSKVFSIGICIFGAVIMLLIATCNHNYLYYSSVSVATYKGVFYLKKTYGPCHKMIYILLFGSNILSLFIAAYSFWKNSKISIKTALEIIIVFTVSVLSYAVTRIIHFPLDVVPFAYVINCCVMLHILSHANMYDMTANLLNVYEQRAEYGYVTLDMKKRFMGCDNFATKIFPCLKDIAIDAPIPKRNSKMNTEILPWLEAWTQGGSGEHVTETGGITVICSIRYIRSNNKNMGYLIELRDVSKQQKYINLLSSYNRQLEGEVENSNEKYIAMQSTIISGMATMVESRDNSTGDHVKRTSACVRLFVKALKDNKKYEYLSDDYCKAIIQSAIMHDLGKISVPDDILRKPGKYTPEDYDSMKKHSEEGARIVREILRDVDEPLFKKIAINVAHYHHERWNGTGYPEGLKGDQIPIEARIMALSDVFDALVSVRCYKTAMSMDEAFDIIKENLGTHFDPELGRIFIECRGQLENLYNS